MNIDYDYISAYKAPQEILFLYDTLSESGKIEVSNAVYDLLKKTKQSFVYAFVKQQLEENEVSYTELANYLFDFLTYNVTEDNPEFYGDDDVNDDVNDDKEDESHLDIEDIKSKLQAFTKNKTVKEDNIWFDYVCDFFNLSRDALCTGRGKCYELKEEKLDKLIKDKYPYFTEPRMEFARHILKDHFILRYNDKQLNKHDLNAISYLENCNRLIAKYSVEEFNVRLTDILEEKEYSMVLSCDTLATIYNSLKSNEQAVIDNFLFKLFRQHENSVVY